MQKTALLLGVFLLIGLTSIPARGQEDDLGVFIVRPGEGETFYTGPSSFLYSAPVSGWVTGYGLDPDKIEVQLEIFQGQVLLGSQTTRLKSNGTFEFQITVNPDTQLEEFFPEAATCAYTCHSPASLGLPTGQGLLRVTAMGLDRQQAVVDRIIYVDRSEFATIPVRVVHTDDPNLILEDIPVEATAWLYLWRARLFTGGTDANGLANVNVEALSRSPTRYLLQIEPVIVDGVFYTSLEPVEVVLPPGAESSAEITLTVTSQTGQISGKLVPDQESSLEQIPIYAISLSDGARFQSITSVEGSFNFIDLPIGRYILAADPAALIRKNVYSAPLEVNLRNQIQTSVEMPVTTRQQIALQGSVLDEQGASLPFAWITPQRTGKPQSVIPADGSFTLYDLPFESSRITVSAPGFYSQEDEVEVVAGASSEVTYQLTRQRETRIIEYGNGGVVIPTESQVEVDEASIALESGWLWGDLGDTQSLLIRTGSANISLQNAKFALEVLPYQSEWLFIFDGQAQIHSPNKPDLITVQTDQMINLLDNEMRAAVAFEPDVLRALHPVEEAPLTFVWEPTMADRVQAQLSKIGVGALQIITFGTYLLGFLSIIIAPIAAIVYWWKSKRRTQPDIEKGKDNNEA